MDRISAVKEIVSIARELVSGTSGGEWPMWVKARYPAKCRKCHAPIGKGEEARYHMRDKNFLCEKCGKREEMRQKARHVVIDVERRFGKEIGNVKNVWYDGYEYYWYPNEGARRKHEYSDRREFIVSLSNELGDKDKAETLARELDKQLEEETR